MSSVPTVIHLPQKLSKIAGRAFVLFVENVLVPAVLVAFFASQGHTVLGIFAVFAWRALFFGTRWRMFRILPATSVLTFAVLSARTGVSFTMGAFGDSSAALTAYLLPACVISVLLGLYFVAQGFGSKPVTLRLAEDFISIPKETEHCILPFARIAAWTWGSVHVVSGLLGAGVVLQAEEATAAALASGLAVATPLTSLFLTAAISIWLGMKSDVRLSLHPAPALA